MNELKLYDLTLVNQVAKGNEAFIKRLCAAFITGSYEAITEMQQATEAGNGPEVSRIAHKVKSTIDTMNVTDARHIIREIESSAGQPGLQQLVPELITKLTAIIEAVSLQIKKDFDLDIKIPRS